MIFALGRMGYEFDAHECQTCLIPPNKAKSVCPAIFFPLATPVRQGHKCRKLTDTKFRTFNSVVARVSRWGQKMRRENPFEC